MTAFKLLNVLALSSLAFLVNIGPTPVNALSIDSAHLHLRNVHHDAIAFNKRSDATKRCKPRPSPSPSPSPPPPPPAQKASPSPSPSPSPNPPAPAPSPQPANTGNSGNNGGLPKIGIAYPLQDTTPLKYFKTNNVGPIYTWSPWCPQGAQALGYTCVPMLWGWKQVGDFQNLVKPGYATHAMGMNEPNEGSQSNMSPQDAANMWRQYLEPLHYQGYTLISPACTNGPTGIQWMKDFYAACQGCHIDINAFHWYGIGADNLIGYANQFHNAFPDKPVWITEFACQDFSGQGKTCPSVFDFMSQVKSFAYNTPWIGSIFAFGIMHDMYNVDPRNQLLGGNDQPTDLGWLYIN